jgi:sugar phosphate permease
MNKNFASNKSMHLNFIINASVAVFITYLCMYAFRKPFTAATYDGYRLFGLDYKVVLIIFQLIGYTISKSLGIKFVSELKPSNRLHVLILLMLIALISLFCFGITPYPYNSIFMFLNGLPLGMIWGVVFSFIEGRKSTELLGAIMASSFIVSSGLVKSSGRLVLDYFHTSEMWMPLVTASLYIPVLILGIYLLKRIHPPALEDEEARTARVPMYDEERKLFIKQFAPGIIFSILIYIALTVFRDMRDNFAVEFWTTMGYSQTPELLAFSEIPIAILIIMIIASMILIKNNKTAFYLIIYLTFICGLLMILSTVAFKASYLNGIAWMMIAGFAMYLPYIGYHTLYFERWIAHFKYKSNAGFLMSMADTGGYLGSTFVLLFKNFATPDIGWKSFFEMSALIVGTLILIIAILNLTSFKKIEKSFNQKFV